MKKVTYIAPITILISGLAFITIKHIKNNRNAKNEMSTEFMSDLENSFAKMDF